MPAHPRKGRPAALGASPFPNGAAIREKGEGAQRLRGMYRIQCLKWRTPLNTMATPRSSAASITS